jgi:hypothetical protein
MVVAVAAVVVMRAPSDAIPRLVGVDDVREARAVPARSAEATSPKAVGTQAVT